MTLNPYYLTSLLSLAAFSSVHAAILGQDQFLTGSTPASGEYTDAAVLNGTGPTGGSVAGFDGNWTASTGSFGEFTTSSTGLSYSGLETSGGSVQYVRSQNGTGGGTKSATRDGGVNEGPSGVAYGSILFQASDWTDNTLTFSVLLGASFFDFGINPGGFAFAEDSGNVGSALAVDTTHLLVFKIEDDTANSSTDLWSFWVNPTDLSSEPTATATGSTADNLMYTGKADFGAFKVTAAFNQNDVMLFDEFRVGDSWSDVAPIPEPSAAGLFLGLSALGVMLGLRRR